MPLVHHAGRRELTKLDSSPRHHTLATSIEHEYIYNGTSIGMHARDACIQHDTQKQIQSIIILNRIDRSKIATIQSVVNMFTHVTRSHTQDFNTLN
jgi:hypothetical protein